MPAIKVQVVINSNENKIFALIRNMEGFPKFMCHVKVIEILERMPDRIISEWKVDIDGAPIEWQEEDIFDEKNMTCKFRTIKGDYQYSGVWKLEEIEKNKTKVSISVNFDWEMPNFEKFIGYLLERKARNSLRSMLNAIKKEAELG